MYPLIEKKSIEKHSLPIHGIQEQIIGSFPQRHVTTVFRSEIWHITKIIVPANDARRIRWIIEGCVADQRWIIEFVQETHQAWPHRIV